MRKVWIFCGLALCATACTPSGVEKEMEKEPVQEKSSLQTENELDQEHVVADELKMDNGIVIRWFEHGSGDPIAHGDVVRIDYKVLLTDGTVVDGNHLLNKPSMPFMVGFQMQTPGWDLALKKLRVGDFAEVFIPSSLARGEKGIEGLIPPNSDNVLKIRILEKENPTREMDGNKVWVFEENPKNAKMFNETNTIEFHAMASTPSKPLFINTFRLNQPFSLNLEDQGVVPGLKKALINAKKSDRMFVYVPASQAYGSKGYQDLVKPNEDIMYNVLVMDVFEK